MKKIIFLTLILIANTINSQVIKENDLTAMKLQGKVKSLKITKHNFIEYQPDSETTYIFNIQGNQTNFDSINSKNKYARSIAYDDSGICPIEMNYNGGYTRYKYTYECNNGNVTKRKMFSPTGFMSDGIETEEYFYDKLNNNTITKAFDQYSNLLYTLKYLFENKKLIEESKFDKNDKIKYKFIYTYDSKGNRVSEKLYENSYGNLTFKYTTTFEYDKNNNLIKNKTLFAYSDREKCDECYSGTRYKYNPNNTIIEVEGYYHSKTEDSPFTKQTYKYDDKKNWIESEFWKFENKQKKYVLVYSEKKDFEYYSQNASSQQKKVDVIATTSYSEESNKNVNQDESNEKLDYDVDGILESKTIYININGFTKRKFIRYFKSQNISTIDNFDERGYHDGYSSSYEEMKTKDKISGNIIEYYQLKEEGNYTKGKKEGKWITYEPLWQPGGNSAENKNYISSVSYYINNELDGEVLKYYPSGKIYIKQFFSNGIKSGEYIEYDEKGKILEKLVYKNDVIIKK